MDENHEHNEAEDLVGSVEARVSINGHELTEGMSMALRLAVHEFAQILLQDPLGDDEMSGSIREIHLESLYKIRRLMAM